ncbi:spermatogenesis associated 6-like protein [Eudromia elegans]
MPLRVAVELQVQAVTCPGVFLPEKQDVYLSVCILGQHKETECLPPVFPLLFNEKMFFEKVFESAVDPAAVTEMLESLVTKFELIQLSSSGDGLAFYKENTRDFLFPEPKLTPAYPGVDRELLMKTSSHFPGIAPKIEFSTRTTITDLPLRCKGKNYAPNRTRNQRSASASPKRRSKSLTQYKASAKRDRVNKRHKRSLKSQAPSPNIRDHFCELPAENLQQLHRPSLRSAECQTDNENRPPLVVRHVDSSKSFSEITSPLSFCNVKKSLKVARDSSKFHVKRGTYQLHPGADSSWEKINERVRSLLTSAQAKQRLSSGVTENEIDDVLQRRSVCLRNAKPNDSGNEATAKKILSESVRTYIWSLSYRDFDWFAFDCNSKIKDFKRTSSHVYGKKPEHLKG